MSLHRTSGQPDWETIPKDHRTRIQRLAANTGGIITPPNIISLIGFVFVVYGLFFLLLDQYWAGLIMLVAGRLLDIADGLIAESTGTKSPLGELVDATADKIGTFLTIAVLFIADIGSWWLIAFLLLPQVIITFVILYKRRGGVHVHPTRIGKISMAFLWISIPGLIILEALELAWPSPIALLVYMIIFASGALGLFALWQYVTGRD